MQRSRPALIAAIALAAAGCNSDRGLAIEISVGDTGATRVALFVGNRACTEDNQGGVHCDSGIAPPGGGPHLAGKIWFRDDTLPFEAVVVGGKATFRLEASKLTTLPLVIAIGSTAEAMPQTDTVAPPAGVAMLTMVEVPSDTARVATATLQKASAAGGPATPAEPVQALAWSTPKNDESCVVLERTVNGKVERSFIVPEDDPDCDAVVDECDPQAAYARNNASDAAPDCYVNTAASADGACRLGAVGCSDATGSTDVCAPTTEPAVCVAVPFCECAGTAADQQGCALAKLAQNADAIPRVVCTIQVSLKDGACKDAHTEINFNGHLNGGCEQPRLVPSLRLADIAPASVSAHFGPLSLDLELTAPDPACHFRLQVNSGSHAPALDEVGMIALQVKQQAVLVPVVFKFTAIPDCQMDTKNECDFVESGNDPMWSCLP